MITYTHPRLTAAHITDLLQNGTRQQLIDWLAWNDANGCYTDEDCRNEGLQLLTHDEARSILHIIAIAEELI